MNKQEFWAVIEQARPVALEGEEVTVAFGLSFFKKHLQPRLLRNVRP